MKRLRCPLNGLRNISEFTYGGEYHPMPDPGQATAGEWAEYLFFDRNEAGVVIEWWFHNASSYWFLAERNTVTDEVVRTFPPDELFAGRVEFPPPANAGDEDA